MMLSEIQVISPRTLNEALELLHRDQAELKIVAGGSDVIVQLRDGIIQAGKLLNVLPLKELRFIRKAGNRLHIGALATYSDIIESELTCRHAWLLVNAAKQIGAVQLQNTATIGGNLGNASPAGDSLPPLYVLDAMVVTRSKSGRRKIPVEDFFVGYRKTAVRPDELIEEVHFDCLNEKDRASYVKFGLRDANAISVVDVAVALRGRMDDGSFSFARVALGAVAPTIRRARRCEEALVHRTLTDETIRQSSSFAVEEASPITDIRGSAEYRRNLVTSLVYEALSEAVFGK